MRLVHLPLELQDEIISLACVSRERFRTCHLRANTHLETWYSVPLGLLLTCRKLYEQTTRAFSSHVRLVVFSTLCSAEAYEHERLFQQLHLDIVGRIDIRLRPPRSDCGPYCDNPLSSLSMLHTWMSCCIVSARCSNLSLTIEKYALGTCYDDLPRSLSRGLLAGFRIGRYARVWDQWEKAYRMKIDFSDQDSRATKDLHLLLPRDLQ